MKVFRAGHRRPWRACVCASAIALAVGTAACGSSETSSSGGTATAAGGRPASGGLAAAQKVATLANTKLLYGPTTGTVTQDQLRAPQASDIKPYAYKPGGPAKKIVW